MDNVRDLEFHIFMNWIPPLNRSMSYRQVARFSHYVSNSSDNIYISKMCIKVYISKYCRCINVIALMWNKFLRAFDISIEISMEHVQVEGLKLACNLEN